MPATSRPTGKPEGRGSLRDDNIEQNSIVITEMGKDKGTVVERKVALSEKTPTSSAQQQKTD